jgi:hypothetical protein
MTTDKKLYAAVAVLAVLGGAVYLQGKKSAEDARIHSVEGAADALPKVQLTDEQVKTIDRVELLKPGAGGDAGAAGPTRIVLVKTGEETWDVAEPVKAKANASNVTSLLDNLKRLEVKEEITPSKDAWGKFDLEDSKALHAVFKKGEEVLLDLRVGQSGSRGQMVRVGDRESVYALKGYSSFLYSRDVAGWRDKKILDFDSKEVEKLTIANANGEFVFTKAGDAWTGKHAAPKGPLKDIEKFDKAKVESLLSAYKALNAADFGDGKSPAEVGLEEPSATVTIDLKGGTGKHVLKVGELAEGSNRWAMRNGSDQIWSVSSWSADWATAAVEKFQESDEPAPAPPQQQMPGMPGMMPGMMPDYDDD